MDAQASSSFSIEIPLNHKLKYNMTPLEISPAGSKLTFQPKHKEMIVKSLINILPLRIYPFPHGII